MSVDPTKLPIKFGPYQLKQKIASGGMAEIYLAETTGPGGFKKPLVIKMIHHAYSDDKRFLSMFTEEAKILSSLTHGNVVPIFDFGTAHGLLYLAMEFIDGVDAATLMEACRIHGIVLPMEIALYIGIGTAAGLAHAHQAGDRGVVHRDVSPQNILLSRSGEVKLCDFGLATYSLEEISTNDAIKGKLKYLSPEQALGEPVDARSDLFSLGVVLHELIAGHHPIPSGSGVTVLQELAGGHGYPSLSDAAPWVPRDIAAIIDKALMFDKSERYQSGEEMRAALTQRLHIDFPSFTPTDLAKLVVRVQTEEEKSVPTEVSEATDDSMCRAQIATFASTTRGRKPAAKHPPTSSSFAKRTLAIALVLIAIAAAVAIGASLHPRGASPSVTDTDTTQIVSGPPPGESDTGAPETTDTGEKAPVAQRPDASTGETPTTDTDTAAPSTSTDSQESDKPAPAVPVKPKPMGIVNLNAAPWADVTIDGVAYTTTPIVGLKLRTGKHKAVFTNPELGVTKTRTFVVKPDEPTTVLVEME